jgi:FkbM family methyltransferase
MNSVKKIFRFINDHPLAKRHKIRAYYKFFSWQLSRRLFSGEAIIPFVGKTKLLAKKGLTGATGNIYTGLVDFNDMGFLLHFLRDGDLFADIGANMGSYSILASGCVGAKTIAFEPIPSSFSWLVKNIELNNLNQRITPMNIGLGSETTELYFTSAHDTVNHVIAQNEISGQDDKLKIPVHTFDDIALSSGIPQLIKIDVEGFETEVMKGMKNALQSDELKAIIIELNGSGLRYGFDESLIHSDLLELNYIPYQYDPFKRTLTQMNGYGPINTIYIKDINFVNNRIAGAAKFKVFSELF